MCFLQLVKIEKYQTKKVLWGTRKQQEKSFNADFLEWQSCHSSAEGFEKSGKGEKGERGEKGKKALILIPQSSITNYIHC